MVRQPDLQPNIVYKQNVPQSLSRLTLTALFTKESLFCGLFISYHLTQKGRSWRGVEVILYIQILKYSTIFKDKNLMF